MCMFQFTRLLGTTRIPASGRQFLFFVYFWITHDQGLSSCRQRIKARYRDEYEPYVQVGHPWRRWQAHWRPESWYIFSRLLSSFYIRFLLIHLILICSRGTCCHQEALPIAQIFTGRSVPTWNSYHWGFFFRSLSFPSINHILFFLTLFVAVIFLFLILRIVTRGQEWELNLSRTQLTPPLSTRWRKASLLYVSRIRVWRIQLISTKSLLSFLSFFFVLLNWKISLYGNGNRFFDKCLQLIVTEDGQVAIPLMPLISCPLVFFFRFLQPENYLLLLLFIFIRRPTIWSIHLWMDKPFSASSLTRITMPHHPLSPYSPLFTLLPLPLPLSLLSLLLRRSYLI